MTTKTGETMNRNTYYIIGSLWLMLSIALPEHRAFDMIVTGCIGFYTLFKGSKL